MKRGNLFIISGPSGTGKGTICKKLLDSDPKLRLSVSVTTRKPRKGEVNGREYHFITEDDYSRLADRDGFLEHASVYGAARYGTPRQPVLDWLSQGLDVILEIDVQGAFQVKRNCPECIMVFILPPSMEELRARMQGRGSETEESMAARLGQAQQEIEQSQHYDYRVVNDDLQTATEQVRQIITKRREE